MDRMVTPGRKKLLILSVAVAAVIVAVLVVLVALGNRVIKAKVEQALGPSFSVEAVSIGWGHVEVVEPRFLRDGQTAASASRIFLSPDILDLFKPGYSISRLVFEEPSMTLEISPDGSWMLPLPVGKGHEPATASGAGPVTVKEIVIRDGTFLFRDLRIPEPNSIEVRKINLSVGNVTYPLKDAPLPFEFSVQAEGKLVSGSIGGSGTIHPRMMAFTGRLDGQNLIFLDTGTAGPFSRVGAIRVTAASEGLPGKSLVLSDLTLTKPFLHLQSDRNGKLIDPLPGRTSKKPGAGKKKGPALPLEVRNLTVDGGEIIYDDGKISRPSTPIRLTDISVTADFLSLPFDTRVTTYRLSCQIPGRQSTGGLISSGTTTLKTADTRGKVSLRDLDLTSFRPYLQKKGDVDITRGFFDMDMDLAIRNRQLYSPVHSVLRDLQFASSGRMTDKFLGLPRDLVVKALEAGDNRIVVDFIAEGSLDNPKFSLQEEHDLPFHDHPGQALGAFRGRDGRGGDHPGQPDAAGGRGRDQEAFQVTPLLDEILSRIVYPD